MIRKRGYVVVAEGNLDVIASHQVDERHVVATAGTAMTSQQFAQLKRFSGDVRLAFDADAAGQAAAERAIPLAQAAGVSLQIVPIASGKDPDELIRSDVRLWKQAIEQPKYAVDWLIERYAQSIDITSAPGKRRLSDVVLKVVSALHDPVEQNHYLGVLADLLGVSREALEQKTNRTSLQKPLRRGSSRGAMHSNLADTAKRTQHFLALMLMYPKLRDLLEDVPAVLFEGEANEVYEALIKATAQPDTKTIVKRLKKQADYVKMLSLLVEETYRSTDFEELRYQTARLRSRLVVDYCKQQKQHLTEQLKTTQDQSMLLAQVKQLDELQQRMTIRE
jgi:DNA primase